MRYLDENQVPLPSLLANSDTLYNSATVAHDLRWDLPLPDIDATLLYVEKVIEGVLERMEKEPDNPSLRYFAELAVFHEDMHGEALFYTRQTLSYPRPRLAGWPRARANTGAALQPCADAPRNEFLVVQQAVAHRDQRNLRRIAGIEFLFYVVEVGADSSRTKE